jgi:hypothetical protein
VSGETETSISLPQGRTLAMDFDNPNWSQLLGGHRLPYDSKRALQALDQGGDRDAAWDELWNELHHQGDVGEASYAAVPYLVRIHIAHGIADWNTYALVATIDECRREGRNPVLPYDLRGEHEQAMVLLAERGLLELKLAGDPNLSRSIIAVVAIWKHLFVLAKLAVDHDEDELRSLIFDVENIRFRVR